MPSILIVDDQAGNRKSLKRFLTDHRPDWTVLTAGNEGEAIQILQKEELDVIITDLVMTGDQGGIEVLKAARKIDPFLMVIVMTSWEKKLDRYQAFELGAFDCVAKNTPGVIAADEILVKTRTALRFREQALERIEDSKRIARLERFIDPRIVDTLRTRPELLGLRQQWETVCFWDVREFSSLCEILRAYPTLISRFLCDYFKAAEDAISAAGGVIDKFIGDGVMALFGGLEGPADQGRMNAINAVNAALDLRNRFSKVLQEWMEEWSMHTNEMINIGLGCGINTAQVLIGNAGTEKRDQYTALGSGVNFAQRLESRAGAGKILISRTTRQRVIDVFILEDADVIDDFKHIPGNHQVYSVVSRK